MEMALRQLLILMQWALRQNLLHHFTLYVYYDMEHNLTTFGFNQLITKHVYWSAGTLRTADVFMQNTPQFVE